MSVVCKNLNGFFRITDGSAEYFGDSKLEGLPPVDHGTFAIVREDRVAKTNVVVGIHSDRQHAEDDARTLATKEMNANFVFVVGEVVGKDSKGVVYQDRIGLASQESASASTIVMPHIYSRIFETPLAITSDKLGEIIEAIGPRLYGQTSASGGFRSDSHQIERTREGLAVISVFGTLVHRSQGMMALSGMTSYESIRAQIEDAATDPTVEAILMDINSSGGESNGLFDLVDFIFEARSVKPIWAVANEQALSAAYAIASAAERIIVPRTAGVGSIGVRAVHRDQSAAEAEAGLKFTEIVAGAHKSDGSPHRPLSSGAQGRIQAEVDRVYEIFVATVARNRSISASGIKSTEADVLFGINGIQGHLADQVGTFEDAERDLLASVGIKIEPPLGGLAMTKVARTDGTTATPKDDSKVAELDAFRDKIEEGYKAYAAEVIGICALAEQPELAAEFIAKKVSLEAIRTKLVEMKAETADAESISTAAGAAEAAEQLKANNYGWDGIFADVTGEVAAK